MKSIRIALASTALVAGLAVAGSKPAAAQVSFSGSFPLPHGRISVGIGDPFFRVGSYVPYGYTVIEDPTYGYGFYYRSRWIPVEPYGSTWVVCERPYFRERGFARPYSYGYGYRNFENRRFDDRRFDNRRFDDRRFDGRRDGRDRDRGGRDRDRGDRNRDRGRDHGRDGRR